VPREQPSCEFVRAIDIGCPDAAGVTHRIVAVAADEHFEFPTVRRAITVVNPSSLRRFGHTRALDIGLQIDCPESHAVGVARHSYTVGQNDPRCGYALSPQWPLKTNLMYKGVH
jgi:hypothetical protein